MFSAGRDPPPAVRQHAEAVLEELLGGPIHTVNRSVGATSTRVLNSLACQAPKCRVELYQSGILLTNSISDLQLYEKHHPVLVQKLLEFTTALTKCFDGEHF